MRKSILLFAALLVTSPALFAQGNKSVFFEIGGNGIGFSGNFDGRFSKKENGLGFRAGIGFVPGTADNGLIDFSTILTIPVGLNYVAGKGPHHFEAGLGATYVSGSFSLLDSDEEKGSGVGFVPSGGYRYASPEKGLQARVFISPFFGSGGSVFWAGLSIGYKF
ncbi:MAG: hypothetical protein JNN00_12855 [Chitinophagaceae bacterium]|nr:hypothetical protein [Chitinophagaceae bacterium]